MHFRFHLHKALQAASVLLEYEKSRRMSSMRLLKLLYVAEREALAETGCPITGDQAVAMKRGPVLSNIHALIRGEAARAGEWDRFIHTDRYEVELVADPGRGELSKGEVAKLVAVSQRYRDLDEWELSDLTHDFVEWQKHFPGGDGTADIPWEEALAAQGRAGLAAAIERDEADRHFFDQLFGG
jgi:uncharacterized phage-associated protein